MFLIDIPGNSVFYLYFVPQDTYSVFGAKHVVRNSNCLQLSLSLEQDSEPFYSYRFFMQAIETLCLKHCNSPSNGRNRVKLIKMFLLINIIMFMFIIRSPLICINIFQTCLSEVSLCLLSRSKVTKACLCQFGFTGNVFVSLQTQIIRT